MYKEVNTGTNLPAQIDLFSTMGDEYHFLFIAKGGGSANKSFLFQQTKALLNEDKLMKFVKEKIQVWDQFSLSTFHGPHIYRTWCRRKNAPNQIWVERTYYTDHRLLPVYDLDQVWSILPAMDLLTYDLSSLWRDKSRGSNSDAGKMDQTWSTRDCEKLLYNLHMR